MTSRLNPESGSGYKGYRARKRCLNRILNEAERKAMSDAVQTYGSASLNPEDRGVKDENKFWEEHMHFAADHGFSKFVTDFWNTTQHEPVEDNVVLELGSGLGTFSLAAAAAGFESYGVERHQIFVDNARNAVEEAYETGLIDDRELVQYAQADILEENGAGWKFENGEEIGIGDADIIYACFPDGEESNEIYRSIAENMDKEAMAILADGGSDVREKYFSRSEEIFIGVEDTNWIYELDTRPSNYSESEF